VAELAYAILAEYARIEPATGLLTLVGGLGGYPMSERTPIMVEVDVDNAASAAYLGFGDRSVARTVEFSESIQVDLDEFDMAIGIEVLDLHGDLPISELVTQYHIPSQVATLLLAIERLAQANSGRTATSSGAAEPAFGTVEAGCSSWTVTTP